ncbi:hypothetical protein [Streptomyces sp. st140]|uniref:hypothetical protein n=1 Tax=Streptomyces sp. st140 TaxID=1828052 RepID=UPI000BF01022|nr:hypothetical protein [Streptomyces sp. st140]
MHFSSEQRLDDAVVERAFTLGEIPGILWTPAALSPDSAPAPLILIGHPPLGLGRMYPRLAGRARHYVAEYGFAAATIELPGCGVRPRWAAAEQARRVTIPLHVLLQWDDEGNDRQAALDLFDAFGSREKTLHANLGGHTGVPQFELDTGARFFARHLTGEPR